MKLTAELITNSLSYINAIKERELDLRGHKIPLIENLAAANDNDAIDLTDNAIPSLSNFPLFPRLKSLYLARNRVSVIATNLAQQLPNLHTLVLAENSVSELADLEPLRHCKHLTHLTLIENPVAARENYRSWIIWLCPQVRFLDYVKVKDAERTAAKEVFGEAFDTPTDATKKVLAVRSGNRFSNGLAAGTNGDATATSNKIRTKLTSEEKARVEKLIREAKSLKEIERLEKMLSEGRIPG